MYRRITLVTKSKKCFLLAPENDKRFVKEDQQELLPSTSNTNIQISCFTSERGEQEKTK